MGNKFILKVLLAVMQKIFQKYNHLVKYFQLEDTDNHREQMVVDYISDNINRFQNIYITGPMNSGKTSTLIKFAELFSDKIIAFSHINDRKRNGGINALVSWGKNKQKYYSQSYQSIQDILGFIIKNNYSDKIILIEEVQFADDLSIPKKILQEFLYQMKLRNCKIIFSGLNTDFKQNMWSNTVLLFDKVDKIIHLNTKCRYKDCKNEAFLNQLYIDNQPATRNIDLIQIGKVGGKKLNFMPVCRYHYTLK